MGSPALFGAGVADRISDEGFVQDYELRVEQELWLYCRLCRRTFPVRFKPKHDKVKLKCLCGHEGPLAEMDVFRDEAAAKEHAAFYDRVYHAAKGALKEAGIPLPPSGKYDAVSPFKDSQFESYFNPEEDQSAIEDGYFDDWSESDSEVSAEAIQQRLAEFELDLASIGDDVLARHDLLSELIEWTYCRRHMHDDALKRFLEACGEDIELASEVIKAAKERMRQGEKQRISFTSFKHLLIHLEEERELEHALVVAERAAKLGLKAYIKKVAELRMRLGI